MVARLVFAAVMAHMWVEAWQELTCGSCKKLRIWLKIGAYFARIKLTFGIITFLRLTLVRKKNSQVMIVCERS